MPRGKTTVAAPKASTKAPAAPKTSTKAVKETKAPTKAPTPTESSLTKLKVDELKALLTKKKLDTGGTKKVLVERILASQEAPATKTTTKSGGSKKGKEVEDEPAPAPTTVKGGKKGAKPKDEAAATAKSGGSKKGAKPAPKETTPEPSEDEGSADDSDENASVDSDEASTTSVEDAKPTKKSGKKEKKAPKVPRYKKDLGKFDTLAIQHADLTFKLTTEEFVEIVQKISGPYLGIDDDDIIRALGASILEEMVSLFTLKEDDKKTTKKTDPSHVEISLNEDLNVQTGEYEGVEYAFKEVSSKWCVYAKVMKGKIVPLSKADVASLTEKKVRIAVDALLEPQKESERKAEHAAVERAAKDEKARKAGEKAAAKKEKEEKAAEKEAVKAAALAAESGSEDSESSDEGGDDGKETVVADPSWGSDDALDATTKQVAALTDTIDKATFTKFADAQAAATNKSDYVAIAKASGLPTETVERIMLQHKTLVTKYPDVIVAAAKKNAKPAQPLVAGRGAQPQAAPRKFLMKK